MLRSCFLWLCLPAAFICGSSWALNFEDVSAEVQFTPAHLDSLPAGGIAVADFNGNGYPDIFVTGGVGYINRLYFNRGDGTFVQSQTINDQVAGENCSVAAAVDFDNDGWPDLYVGCRTSDNLLLRNLSGRGFENVTPEALNHAAPEPTTRTDAVAWADLTGNGYLDLYIGIFTPDADLENPDNLDRIMLNHGDGTWTNAAEALDPAKLNRQALAVVMTDLTGNGRPDIYVVNDKLAGNVLWRNDGPGCDGWCFSDISQETGTGIHAYGMGIAVADVNRNGLWDLYFSSIFAQHLLRGVSDDPLLFEEDPDSVLNRNAVGWGTIFADFNNDGWEDAFLAVGPEAFTPTTLVDRLFKNQGDGTFVDVTFGSGLYKQIPTQGAAYIDFERNGRLDLILHHWNQAPGYRLYENTTGNVGNWIAFELEGGGPVNRDAIGTRITIQIPGEDAQRRELRAGESRGASHDRILHFGLGPHRYADVTVHWPDGTVEALGRFGACRYHELIYTAHVPEIDPTDVMIPGHTRSHCD